MAFLVDVKECIPQGLKPALVGSGIAEAKVSAYLHANEEQAYLEARSVPQRLKPQGGEASYGTAEAVPLSKAKDEEPATASAATTVSARTSANANPKTTANVAVTASTDAGILPLRVAQGQNDGLEPASSEADPPPAAKDDKGGVVYEGALVDAEFAIEEFLHAEQAKDLLRFSTAGSVDDGKSTLIGRLLYDSRNVYEDQVRAVTGAVTSSAGVKSVAIDFALLTDGLRAEREQGITIDVAYRYFSTQRRKFIIADTPGHEQYTRNMATGASTADLAIILIDARKGILTQSRRHAFIASLLGIRHLVAAVNKMDLVDYSEEVYRGIEAELRELVEVSFASANDAHISESRYGAPEFVVIPVSALEGDNVVDRSERMPWYSGPTLLEHLEEVPVGVDEAVTGFRLPVQRVIRPDQSYRGFAGQIAAGVIRKGDEIVALPSGRRSRVASITTFDGDLEEARAPMSIALTLEDELDVSRGDLITTLDSQPGWMPTGATAINAAMVWFDAARLESHKPYLLKHGAQTLPARVTRVLYRNNIETLEHEAVNSLAMNDVGVVEIALTRALYFDAYAENRATGSFILIDPATNATVAAGMIRRGLAGGSHAAPTKHKAALVFVPETRADEVELALLAADVPVVRTKVKTPHVLQALFAAGVVVLMEGLAVVEEAEGIDAMELTDEELLERLRG